MLLLLVPTLNFKTFYKKTQKHDYTIPWHMEVNVSLRPVHEHPRELFQQNLENQTLAQPMFMKKCIVPFMLITRSTSNKKKTIFLQFNHSNTNIIGVQRSRMAGTLLWQTQNPNMSQVYKNLQTLPAKNNFSFSVTIFWNWGGWFLAFSAVTLCLVILLVSLFIKSFENLGSL